MKILLGVLLACAFPAVVSASAPLEVTTPAPGWTFTSAETPVFLLSGSVSELHWKLRDWRGGTVDEGTWPQDGRLALRPLPPGYYRGLFEGVDNERSDSFSFCVTRPDPCRDLDSFFAVDSAFTEISRKGVYRCPWYGGDCLRVTAELMGKCGITRTRERNLWSRMEPVRGTYRFGDYLENARLLARNGVKSVGLLNGTPKWLRRPGRTLPDDLVETYRFLRSVTKAFEPYYDAWEFRNEPELHSTPEPVWEYAAALKAAALGIRDGSETTVALPGSLAGIDGNGYARTLYGADLNKYVQAFNIHTYCPPSKIGSWARGVRSFLSECGMPDAQVWLTESGTDLESHGRIPSARKGLMAHDAEQEMIVAEFAVKSAVLQRFHGTFRNWFFLFGVYNERHGEKDWGSMRRDGSPKPVHAALSALTGELGSADQLGRVNLGCGVAAYLYARKDGGRTLVLWTESPVDTASGTVLGKTDPGAREVSVPVSSGTYSLTDMMGASDRVEVADRPLRLAIDRYPKYLTGPISLPVETASRPTGTCTRYRPAEDEDLSVVIRPEVDTNDFSIVGKSLAELQGDHGRIRLEVWNLSDSAKQGSLMFSAGSVRGVPREIQLPDWGKSDVAVEWTPPSGTNDLFTLDVSGVFGGKRVSRVRIPVSCPSRFLSACTVQELERLNRPESWRRNDSGAQWACKYDEEEKAVRFDVSWKPGSPKWFYPECRLALPGESPEGAKYLEFEVRTSQDKVENDFACQNVMLVGPASDSHLGYLAPSDVWEKRRVRLPPSASSATALRIGANPKGSRLTFWLRNIRLLKAKEDHP